MHDPVAVTLLVLLGVGVITIVGGLLAAVVFWFERRLGP
jgi:hypothetical protein